MSAFAASILSFTESHIVGLMGAAIPIAVLLLILCFARRRVSGASVASFEWHRSVSLQIQEWVTRTSEFGPPANARNVRSTSKLVSEGYFTTEYRYRSTIGGGCEYRPETVHKTRWVRRTVYTYEIPVWRGGRTITASGGDRDRVEWPAYTLAFNERVRRQWERYTVVFTAPGGRNYKKGLPHERWCDLDEAARYDLAITLVGRVTRIRPSVR
jgi:hypothetical protein